MNRRNATTTHAAANDCQRRRKSGRRVSRHRTGLSETEREVDLTGIAPASGAGGGRDAEVGELGSGGMVEGAGGGRLFAGVGAGALPADSDSRLATRRRLNAASIVRSAANPV